MQPNVSFSQITENQLREKIKIKTLFLIEKDKEIAQLIALCRDKDEQFKLILESQSQYYSQNSSLSAAEYNNLIKYHSISQEKLFETMKLCGKQQEIIKGFIERIKNRISLLDNNLSTLETKLNKEIKMHNIFKDLNEKLLVISLNIREKRDEIETLSLKFNTLKKLSENSKKFKRDYKNKLLNEKNHEYKNLAIKVNTQKDEIQSLRQKNKKLTQKNNALKHIIKEQKLIKVKQSERFLKIYFY